MLRTVHHALMVGSLKKNTTLEYSTRVVQEGDHRVHRVATAAFWRTFSDEGKICPGW